jgi:hypothetical protein
MTEWTKEEDEAFNEVEKHSNLGKQILREIGQPYHFEKREWVGLTDEELHVLFDSPMTPTGLDWAKKIEAKLKEKNT